MCSEGIQNKETASDQPLPTELDQENHFASSKQSKIQKSLMLYDILSTLSHDYFDSMHQSEDHIKNITTLIRDLEVYCGEGDHPEINIASILDHTHSASGSVVLRKMLTNPIAATRNQEFVDRQKLIHALVHNEEFFDKVNSLCQEWANNENRMLTNWQQLDEVATKQIDDWYYQYGILQRFNTNPYAMELRVRASNLHSFFQAFQVPITWATFCVGLRTLDSKFNANYEGSLKDAFVQGCKEFAQENVPAVADILFHPFKNYQKGRQEFLQQVEFERNRALHEGKEFNEDVWNAIDKVNKGVFIGIPIVSWAFTAYIAYNAYSHYHQARLHQDALDFVHNKLIGMGNALRSVSELEKLAQEHTILASGLVSWQHAQNLFGNDNKDVTYLTNLLQKNTFNGDASFFSLSGRVLSANKLMDQYKDAFAGIIELMGELDACLSVAKVVKEFANARVHYCFVNLHTNTRPGMQLTNFWNPFVDHTKVVTNNIALGGDKKEKLVVLTGSNTGGKSTVGLKGSLIALYMGHTLGIAPADICDASLFHDFCSYLHVLDDTASGHSSFQAEVNRAQSLLKMAKSLPANQCAFIVIDELFKGTTPEQGSSNAYKIVKALSQFDNVMCIVATHFKDLTQLPEETDGLCVNMKIDVYKDEQGSLVRPHKLEYGISTNNVADVIMQSHFEDIGVAL